MRYTQFFPKTLKEAPKDEVAINAKYLIRGGFIDKLMAGSYSLLPLGRKVERKIEEIIRQEINKTGAQEVLLPLLHPKDIWNETGRWDSAKEVMYQFAKDEKEYALSFTHEEIVMDLIRKHVTSYKDLPLKVYHFSTKFRNELRAKSGILRGREFLMKDLYSAHTSEEDLMNYYEEVTKAYVSIFKRFGLEIKVTEAAGGVFTKNNTREFQIESKSGEDTIYFKNGWNYWKNKEVMTDEEINNPDLQSISSIEVGNIFPLGTYYSEKMGAFYTDKDGSRKPIWFGSYGIGPTRVMGTIVEVSHDEKGIIWPKTVSPFDCHLIGLSDESNNIYEQLKKHSLDVLFDDREYATAGEKFADADLLGIPYRLVVSKKTNGQIEWKERNSDTLELLTLEQVVKRLHD